MKSRVLQRTCLHPNWLFAPDGIPKSSWKWPSCDYDVTERASCCHSTFSIPRQRVAFKRTKSPAWYRQKQISRRIRKIWPHCYLRLRARYAIWSESFQCDSNWRDQWQCEGSLLDWLSEKARPTSSRTLCPPLHTQLELEHISKTRLCER
jgi:hypothetical protein